MSAAGDGEGLLSRARYWAADPDCKEITTSGLKCVLFEIKTVLDVFVCMTFSMPTGGEVRRKAGRQQMKAPVRGHQENGVLDGRVKFASGLRMAARRGRPQSSVKSDSVIDHPPRRAGLRAHGQVMPSGCLLLTPIGPTVCP